VTLALLVALAAAAPPEVRVGSKAFTESIVLGEIAAGAIRAGGADVVHQAQLGGTRIVWNALLRGDIDVYPEYTGTLEREILASEGVGGAEALAAALAARGVRLGPPLGFENDYALGMQESVAERLGIRRISQLRAHPELRFGLTNEFLDRTDGWPSLRDAYALPQRPTGLEHDLAYRGLAAGTLDVVDLYSTDADIRYYGLRVLEDDLHHFARYDAVLLWRTDLETRAPNAVAALRRLGGRIDGAAMIALNARVRLDGESEAAAARGFLRQRLGLAERSSHGETVLARLARNTRDHLALVASSLAVAVALALPLGILAARRPRIGAAVLAATGVLQTVPSLALLVLLIPLFGIGANAAIVALVLYSLLPIVRNTHAGLIAIPGPLRESSLALGLTPRARLLSVDLPLASPAILAGIKTSAVINVGTATLGALIGAGGYGQPILTGIRLDDAGLLLQGALPAAALAIAMQGLFGVLERIVVPRGLRLATAR
jgi:osmoprotectant transport system permease protein